MTEIKKKVSQEQYDAEMAELELQMKRLQLSEMQEQIATRSMQKANRFGTAKMNGVELDRAQSYQEAVEHQCTHRKGGEGMNAIMQGQGDDSQYAVQKHRFNNNDIWVFCLRCHKTWKPVLREDCVSDEQYTKIMAEYKQALGLQTKNKMSGSAQFRWEDGPDVLRRALKNTNIV